MNPITTYETNGTTKEKSSLLKIPSLIIGIVATFLVAGIVVGISAVSNMGSSSEATNRPTSPEFSAVTINAQMVHSSNLAGKLTILVFWSRDWEGSTAHFDYFNSLTEHNPNVAVYGVPLYRNIDAIDRFVRLQQVQFDQFVDVYDEMALKYMVTNLPHYVILDGSNRIAFSQGGDVDIRAEVERLLQQ